MPALPGASLRRHAGDEQHAEHARAVLDLVFVLAITQVAHLLLAGPDLAGRSAGSTCAAGRLVVLELHDVGDQRAQSRVDHRPAAADRVDARHPPDGDRDSAGVRRGGPLFVGCYVAIQVGRHSFLTFVAADPGTIERQRAGRILAWFVAAGILRIAGALADGSARTALWLAALALDYGAPLVTFWLPGRPRLSPEVWEIGTEHFAERFQLFIIIALGESIVITGTTTAQLELTFTTLVAFGLAFLAAAALWWLYFNLVATIAERRLASAKNRTLPRPRRLHLPARRDRRGHPPHRGRRRARDRVRDAAGRRTRELDRGGQRPGALPARACRAAAADDGNGQRQTTRGALACLAVAAIGTFAPALVVAALLFGVLVAVIVGDQLAAARRKARVEPSALEG